MVGLPLGVALVCWNCVYGAEGRLKMVRLLSTAVALCLLAVMDLRGIDFAFGLITEHSDFLVSMGLVLVVVLCFLTVTILRHLFAWVKKGFTMPRP